MSLKKHISNPTFFYGECLAVKEDLTRASACVRENILIFSRMTLNISPTNTINKIPKSFIMLCLCLITSNMSWDKLPVPTFLQG